jgi:hypothetical protein
MIRNVIAVLVGLFVGMAANMAVVQLNLLMFPLPEGVSWTDDAELIAWIETLPQSAFVLVLVAHLAQSFCGGLIAGFIAKRNVMQIAMTVGILTSIGGLVNLLRIPAPFWFWIELPLYLIVAWAGAKIVLRIRTNCCA